MKGHDGVDAVVLDRQRERGGRGSSARCWVRGGLPLHVCPKTRKPVDSAIMGIRVHTVFTSCSLLCEGARPPPSRSMQAGSGWTNNFLKPVNPTVSEKHLKGHEPATWFDLRVRKNYTRSRPSQRPANSLSLLSRFRWC